MPPLLQKLWDRGVDIDVGVITSVIVAAIGLAGWRIKLWLDLHADERKQRQQAGIAEQLLIATRKRETQQRYLRLTEERDAHATNIAGCTVAVELLDAWRRYEEWLQSENLQNRLRNLDLRRAMANELDHMRENAHTARLAAFLPWEIRRTEIPPPNG